MTADAGAGLIRVARFGRTVALTTAAGAVVSEGLLLALIATPRRLESLLVGAVVVTVMSVVWLPFAFLLPAGFRRRYEQAVWIDTVGEPGAGRDEAGRLSLRRTAGFVAVVVCWMVLIGLASHQLMPPFMLIPVAVTQWARSRATARWERENGTAVWQRVPGVLGARGPLYRSEAPADL
ncbi:hypothetical protein WJM95_16925 [Streptomyces sp. f51]|uniref:hypothetical protein n=1 Tax=Streptomyces sp. f51 TaxID=1827742 RepID=UPI0030D0936F